VERVGGVCHPKHRPLSGNHLVIAFDNLTAERNAADNRPRCVLQGVDSLLAGVQTRLAQHHIAVVANSLADLDDLLGSPSKSLIFLQPVPVLLAVHATISFRSV
jgi:hypothetical protein